MKGKHILLASAISVGYLVLASLLIGFKTEQLVLVLLFNICYYLSKPTRHLILALSVFMVFWIIFDLMKAFPNYRYNPVHIQSLYEADKHYFGINHGDTKLTVNEWLRLHQHKILDVLSGFFYLMWIPGPIFFGLYLFYTKRRKQCFDFTLTFLLVNFIGFVIYYVYPAAPPWYVALHGFQFDPHTPGNTAGLGRFDAFFGIHLFEGMYAKSSNVFAAMPSLHAAYPTITFIYAVKNKLKYASILFFALMIGIWFTALYTNHHYVLDIVMGLFCTFSGYLLYQWLYKKSKGFRGFVDYAVAEVMK
ncbi:MAG: phosphatase PAP2 family protein [Chitinophagaceae bacterium]